MVAPPEPEEIETEMSLIDASMQPGSVVVKETAIPEREMQQQPDTTARPDTPPADEKSDKEKEATANRPIMLEQLKATSSSQNEEEKAVWS